jgi:hypothetical protein
MYAGARRRSDTEEGIMKRLLIVRVAIAAFVLAVGALAYMALLPQPAAMFTPGVCTYYSSAKYKTVVGQRGSGCCGETISWGDVTAYRRCEQMWCTDVVCPDPTE